MKTRFSGVVVGLFLALWTLPFQTVQAGSRGLPLFQEASATPEAEFTPEPTAPSPADIIEAVNNLRFAHGLNALSVHPVLMEVAAQQANALAASEGMIGHQRPCGMTLGQQLLLMGFPLWGDLSRDGYRSENWVTAFTVEQVMEFWQGDAEHSNTMLSEFRSDIGAAVAASNQIYVVLETALRTNTGQMQSPAYPILTSIPITQAACLGQLTPNSDGSISQYSIPVSVNTARPDGDVVHQVQYGQTLWSLAIQYKVRIEDIKRLNGLTNDTIVPGWKLLIQEAATQPVPYIPTTILVSSIQTQTPFITPIWTATPSATAAPDEVSILVQSLGQNKVVVAALIISFSVLVAGVVGFGRKKE